LSLSSCWKRGKLLISDLITLYLPPLLAKEKREDLKERYHKSPTRDGEATLASLETELSKVN